MFHGPWTRAPVSHWRRVMPMICCDDVLSNTVHQRSPSTRPWTRGHFGHRCPPAVSTVVWTYLYAGHRFPQAVFTLPTMCGTILLYLDCSALPDSSNVNVEASSRLVRSADPGHVTERSVGGSVSVRRQDFNPSDATDTYSDRRSIFIRRH